MTTLMDMPPGVDHESLTTDWVSTPGIRTMRPIDLATLSQRAALMTRRDRKYLVDRDLLPSFVDRLHDTALVLEIDGLRQFGYESCYFDTPTLTSYLLAARRRPRRFKVRTRTYLDADTQWLEVKIRDGRGRIHKTRIPWTAPRTGGLGTGGEAFVAEQLVGTVEDPHRVVGQLVPTLTTQYLRTTLHLPADGARVTIDESLEAWDRVGNEVVAPGLVIVETKGAGPACAADRILWSLGQRPVRISKYATSLARIHPGLPATAWRPALRRLGAGDPRCAVA